MRSAVFVSALMMVTSGVAGAGTINDSYMSWSESSTTNALTGRTSVEYATPGQTLSGPDGITGQLWIRCKDGELQSFILFNQYFSSLQTFWYWAQGEKEKGPYLAEAAASGRASFLKDEKDV